MEKDYEKKIQDIMNSMSPEKRAEDFFIENYSNQWEKISESERKDIISRFIEHSNPLKMKETENFIKKYESFENKKFDIIILFLGVIFGISGNLIANLLDKYLSYLGYKYNIFVIIFFILSSWFIYYFFIKKTAKAIKEKENSIELLKIIEIVENHK